MKANKEDQKPHGFCVTPGSKCTMNYCDDNGCNDRKLAPGYEVKTDLHTNNLKEIVGAFPDFPQEKDIDATQSKESQEELWGSVTDIVEDKIGKYYADLPTGQLTFNIVEAMRDQFTITRNSDNK